MTARNYAATIDTVVKSVTPATHTKVCKVLGDGRGNFSVCEVAAGSTSLAAAYVSIADAGNKFTGTNVETALSEVVTTAALAAVTASNGATLVGVRDVATRFTATEVETALTEVPTFVELAATTANKGASLVGVRDLATLYTAADVEAALAEVRLVANAAPQQRTITFGFASLSGLGPGVTTYINSDAGGALPAGAVVCGYSISNLTFFSDGAVGAYTVEFGVAGAADVMASTDVAAGAAPKAGTAASLGYPGAPAVGTFSVKLTGSVDLNTTTAGSITAKLYYFVPA